MSELNILKWNVDFGNTTSGGRNTYVPFAIVQPSLQWLAQAKANDNILYVEVSDSGIYDGGYRAVLEPTSNLPNPRPNYFAATGAYALTLIDADWDGYPPNGALGKIKISDGIVTPGQGYVVPKPDAQSDFDKAADNLAQELVEKHGTTDLAADSDSDSSGSLPWYIWLIIAITLIIVLLMIIVSILQSRRKNSA